MTKFGKYIFTKEWQKLADAEPKTRPQAFLDYSQVIINAQAAGDLDIATASYNICGAIRFDELEAIPELEEAISIACDLEMPAAHRSSRNQNDAKSWQRLKLLIDSYATGQRKVELRLKIEGAIENSHGQITSSFSGWAYRRQNQTIINLGHDSLAQALTAFCKSLTTGHDDKEWLETIKNWLLMPGRIQNCRLTCTIVEHTRASDDHTDFHSSNAFCGSAGPAEMQHLQALIDQLSDQELSRLVDKVGIKFESAAANPTRNVLEGVIDEADRESFYSEYQSLIVARTNKT